MAKDYESGEMEMTTQSQAFSAAATQAGERRLALRYALHARVVFAWDDSKGQKRESRGHTRDLGQKGAFVIAQECPARDARVSLSIFLPVTGSEQRVLRLEVEGRVLRSGVGSGSGDAGEPPVPIGFAVCHQRVNLFSS